MKGKAGSLPTSGFQGGRKTQLIRHPGVSRVPVIRTWPSLPGREGARGPTEDWSGRASLPILRKRRCSLLGQEVAGRRAKENCRRGHFSGVTG